MMCWVVSTQRRNLSGVPEELHIEEVYQSYESLIHSYTVAG